MRRFLLRFVSLLIFVLFTSFPFAKVSAYSILIDENGRFVVVGSDGQVLGDQSNGPMPSNSGGGGQQNNQPSQQQQQQMMQQRPPEQGQSRPSSPQQQTQQTQQFQQGKQFQPAGSAGEMQKRGQDLPAGRQEMMRIGVQKGELRVQSPQGSTGNADSVKIRESTRKHEVEIKANGNELELNQQNVRAKTRFPISVNDKNELTVTTPNGTKTVTVLPDEAVKEAMRRGGMTSFGAVGQQTGTGATGKQQVELTQENGKLEYKVEGVKEAKLFGFFPVSSQVETHVSAETGAVTSVSQPWFFSNFGFLFR